MIAVVVVVLGIFVAFFIICIIKRRKTRQEEAKRKTSDEVNNVLIHSVSFHYDHLGSFECIFPFRYLLYKCSTLFMYVYVHSKVKKKLVLYVKGFTTKRKLASFLTHYSEVMITVR